MDNSFSDFRSVGSQQGRSGSRNSESVDERPECQAIPDYEDDDDDLTSDEYEEEEDEPLDEATKTAAAALVVDQEQYDADFWGGSRPQTTRLLEEDPLSERFRTRIRSLMLSALMTKGDLLDEGLTVADLNRHLRDVTNGSISLEVIAQLLDAGPKCQRNLINLATLDIFEDIVERTPHGTLRPKTTDPLLADLIEQVKRTGITAKEREKKDEQRKKDICNRPENKMRYMHTNNLFCHLIILAENANYGEKVTWQQVMDLYNLLTVNDMSSSKIKAKTCEGLRQLYAKYKDILKLDEFPHFNPKACKHLFGRSKVLTALSMLVFERIHVEENQEKPGSFWVSVDVDTCQYTPAEFQKVKDEMREAEEALVRIRSTGGPRPFDPQRYEENKRRRQIEEEARQEERRKVYQEKTLPTYDDCPPNAFGGVIESVRPVAAPVVSVSPVPSPPEPSLPEPSPPAAGPDDGPNWDGEEDSDPVEGTAPRAQSTPQMQKSSTSSSVVQQEQREAPDSDPELSSDDDPEMEQVPYYSDQGEDEKREIERERAEEAEKVRKRDEQRRIRLEKQEKEDAERQKEEDERKKEEERRLKEERKAAQAAAAEKQRREREAEKLRLEKQRQAQLEKQRQEDERQRRRPAAFPNADADVGFGRKIVDDDADDVMQQIQNQMNSSPERVASFVEHSERLVSSGQRRMEASPSQGHSSASQMQPAFQNHVTQASGVRPMQSQMIRPQMPNEPHPLHVQERKKLEQEALRKKQEAPANKKDTRFGASDFGRGLDSRPNTSALNTSFSQTGSVFESLGRNRPRGDFAPSHPQRGYSPQPTRDQRMGAPPPRQVPPTHYGADPRQAPPPHQAPPTRYADYASSPHQQSQYYGRQSSQEQYYRGDPKNGWSDRNREANEYFDGRPPYVEERSRQERDDAGYRRDMDGYRQPEYQPPHSEYGSKQGQEPRGIDFDRPPSAFARPIEEPHAPMHSNSFTSRNGPRREVQGGGRDREPEFDPRYSTERRDFDQQSVGPSRAPSIYNEDVRPSTGMTHRGPPPPQLGSVPVHRPPVPNMVSTYVQSDSLASIFDEMGLVCSDPSQLGDDRLLIVNFLKMHVYVYRAKEAITERLWSRMRANLPLSLDPVNLFGPDWVHHVLAAAPQLKVFECDDDDILFAWRK